MTAEQGRANQRRRTRKDLLQAAARLTGQGHRPSLEEVAAEALVSRATAYRYFPNVEELLVEAALDIAVPEAHALFANGAPDDPAERVERVDAALDAMIAANEVPLRLMLAHTLTRRAGDVPVRQNRRTPLLAAALAPARDKFGADTYDTLLCALALVVGTESMVVFRDVLQLDMDKAHRVKSWAIRALVEAALRDGKAG